MPFSCPVVCVASTPLWCPFILDFLEEPPFKILVKGPLPGHFVAPNIPHELWKSIGQALPSSLLACSDPGSAVSGHRTWDQASVFVRTGITLPFLQGPGIACYWKESCQSQILFESGGWSKTSLHCSLWSFFRPCRGLLRVKPF